MVEVVSPNLSSKINYKVMIGIFIGVILLQIYLNMIDNEDQIEISIEDLTDQQKNLFDAIEANTRA